MPVGTYGTVKAMTPEELDGLGAHIVLGNTFHLMLRPGTEIVRAHGGLHGFMHWQQPDPHRLRRLPGVQPARACARSPRRACASARPSTAPTCGSRPRFDGRAAARWARTSRWRSTTARRTPRPKTQARASMERSMRWAARSHAHYYRGQSAGSARPASCSASCRAACIVPCAWPRSRRCSKLPIGRALPSAGWPWASPRKTGCGCSKASCRTCRADRPRYLMGVGRPEDIIAAVLRGIDMFDCVMPTRHARNGHLFTSQGVRQHPQCRPPGGHRPAGSGLRLLHLPQLLARLPAPPRPLQRNPRAPGSTPSTTCISTWTSCAACARHRGRVAHAEFARLQDRDWSRPHASVA